MEYVFIARNIQDAITAKSSVHLLGVRVNRDRFLFVSTATIIDVKRNTYLLSATRFRCGISVVLALIDLGTRDEGVILIRGSRSDLSNLPVVVTFV